MSVDYQQFVGKPFQVISHLGIRYTGIFDHISQEDQVVCLSRVFSWGTEDRPTQRQQPINPNCLGWVRFKTDGIESLAVVENYIEPGQPQVVHDDPTLASVSQHRPGRGPGQPQYPPQQSAPPPQSSFPPQGSYPTGPQDARPPQVPRHNSAAKAMERVQQGLADLSSRPRGPEPVPATDFDFSQNQKFEQEREAARRRDSESQNGEAADQDGDDPLQPVGGAPASSSKAPVYQKSSFFDGLSSQTGRTNRNEERHRNLDTFGEAGGNQSYGHYNRGGGRGGRGGRGGYGQQGRGGGGHFGGGGGGRGRGDQAWRGGNGYTQPA